MLILLEIVLLLLEIDSQKQDCWVVGIYTVLIFKGCNSNLWTVCWLFLHLLASKGQDPISNFITR